MAERAAYLVDAVFPDVPVRQWVLSLPHRLRYLLRHRWADGTTHLRFDPLERLAVLTPRPRVNLILYYGVLAPRAAWRSAMVVATADGVDAGASSGEPDVMRAVSPGPERIIRPLI